MSCDGDTFCRHTLKKRPFNSIVCVRRQIGNGTPSPPTVSKRLRISANRRATAVLLLKYSAAGSLAAAAPPVDVARDGDLEESYHTHIAFFLRFRVVYRGVSIDTHTRRNAYCMRFYAIALLFPRYYTRNYF